MTEELKDTGDKHAAGAAAEAVEEAIKAAPKKDVGVFLKMVGVAIFLLCLGIAISFVMRGSVSVNTKADVKVGDSSVSEELNNMKNEAAEAKGPLKIGQTIEGAAPGTVINKTVTVETPKE